jgi:hypothetical protein
VSAFVEKGVSSQRIKAGMTVQEVKEVLPDVLADVRTWVRKVNNLAE